MPSEKHIHPAAEIASNLKGGDNVTASWSLADDYLRMTPQEFKSTVQDLNKLTANSKSAQVYESKNSKGNYEIYVNDAYINDTRLFSTSRNYIPHSPSLANPEMEDVARKFNNMLCTSRENKGYRTDKAAASALLDYANELPRKERATLLQRAQQINMELTEKGIPHLEIAFSDTTGDGLPIDPIRMRLSMPAYCNNHGIFEGVVDINLK